MRNNRLICQLSGHTRIKWSLSYIRIMDVCEMPTEKPVVYSCETNFINLGI